MVVFGLVVFLSIIEPSLPEEHPLLLEELPMLPTFSKFATMMRFAKMAIPVMDEKCASTQFATFKMSLYAMEPKRRMQFRS